MPVASPKQADVRLLLSIGLFCGLVGLAGCGRSTTGAEGDRESGDRDAVKPATAALRHRTFRFDYRFTLVGLPESSDVRVWIPVPPENTHQAVTELERRLPVSPSRHKEPKYGNRMLHFATQGPATGELAFSIAYRIKRSEIRTDESDGRPRLTPAQRRLFLSANRKVPVGGRPTDLLKEMRLPKSSLGLGRALYDRVGEHVTYDKSRPGYGNGDVLWVCDSRYGNCTDFHSLFISLARSQGLPARFEIGFPLPEERGAGRIAGYHCWAFFHTPKQGWVPTDISEGDKNPKLRDYCFGNLSEDRVTFNVGRDIDLVPKQSAPALNYFVYPHVEVDGKPLDRKQIRLSFAYADLKTADPR